MIGSVEIQKANEGFEGEECCGFAIGGGGLALLPSSGGMIIVQGYSERFAADLCCGA
jgi:hypothetical protein